MHPHAEAAVRAAKNRKSWGQYATFLYLRKRGVPFKLYWIALDLELKKQLGWSI